MTPSSNAHWEFEATKGQHGTEGQFQSFHPLSVGSNPTLQKNMSNGEGGGGMPEKSSLPLDLQYKTALYLNLGIDRAQKIFNTLPR